MLEFAMVYSLKVDNEDETFKASAREVEKMGIMRKLQYSLNRNALNQMYMSYMLPIVEYASLVWEGCSEQD